MGGKTSRGATIGGWLGTAGLLLTAGFFLSQAGYALLDPRYYEGSTIHAVRYLYAPLSLALAFAAMAFLLRRRVRSQVAVYSVLLIVALFLNELMFGLAQVRERRTHVDALQDTATSNGVRLGWTPGRINHALEVDRLSDMILANYPLSNVLLCADESGPVIVRTDRFGLRNSDPLYGNRVDVAFAGDSLIHGFCLRPGDDVVSKFAELGHNAMNAAQTGTGPMAQLAIVGRYLPEVHPATVVMCFTEANDLTDLSLESGDPVLSDVLEDNADFGPSALVTTNLSRAADHEKVVFTQLEQRRRGSVLSRAANLSAWLNILALRRTSIALGLHYGPAPRNVDVYGRVLAKARQVVGSWGGELFLCYIPNRDRFVGLLSPAAALDVARGRVIEAARAAGIPAIDLTDAFGTHPRPSDLYWIDGVHFSKEGAALAAQVLAEGLARAGRSGG